MSLSSDIYDVQFERLFSENELRSTLAQIYGVKPQEIIVRADRDDWSSVKDSHIVICTQEQIQSNFPSLLTIFGGNYHDWETEKETVEQLVMALNTRALIPHESPNPFLCYVINVDGEYSLAEYV